MFPIQLGDYADRILKTAFNFSCWIKGFPKGNVRIFISFLHIVYFSHTHVRPFSSFMYSLSINHIREHVFSIWIILATGPEMTSFLILLS